MYISYTVYLVLYLIIGVYLCHHIFFFWHNILQSIPQINEANHTVAEDGIQITTLLITTLTMTQKNYLSVVMRLALCRFSKQNVVFSFLGRVYVQAMHHYAIFH